jgi:23S rRNA (pseudouridine1915-N3)-methyltransferase
MKLVIISVGKKHDASLVDAIHDYTARISRSVNVSWEFIVPSGRSGDMARQEESIKILERCKPGALVWLLDETGDQITSPTLAQKLETAQNNSVDNIVIIIGGAFGVDETVHSRADFVWSLSKLVFPHQIVRLLLAEQLYRAYEINRGSGYHHE